MSAKKTILFFVLLFVLFSGSCSDESKINIKLKTTVLVEPPLWFYDIESFNDGLAVVKKPDITDTYLVYGVIDKSGNIVIPLEYDGILGFSDGLATVVKDYDRDDNKDNKWGVIDKTGNIVIPLEYDGIAKCFSEGLASAKKDGKWGFINENNNVVIPFVYDEAFNFNEGLARIFIGDLATDDWRIQPGRWGFIDKIGNIVMSFTDYDYLWDFSDGLAMVEKNRGEYGHGLIDKTGNFVVPLGEYFIRYTFSSEGLWTVSKNGNRKYGFIDNNGILVIPCIYDYAYYFSEGLARIYIDNSIKRDYYTEQHLKWGYIDKTGKIAVPCIYDSASDLYDYASDFREGVALVSKDGKCYILEIEK